MRTDSINHLFIDLLKDLYNSECETVMILPEIINAVQTKDLKDLISSHLENSKLQVERIKKALGSINESLEGEKCKAIEGFSNEFHEFLKQGSPSIIKDAGIIALMQRIQHYEIASYGTLRTYADLLGYKEIAKLLNESINEEGSFDKKLTAIAQGGIFKSGINKEAKKAA